MDISTLVSLVIALMVCFLGYKLMKFWVTVAGVVVFGVLGAGLGLWLGSLAEIDWLPPALALVVGIILAIFGGIISHKIHKLGAFVYCFSCGISLGGTGYLALGAPEGGWIVVLVLGVVLGIIGVLMTKHIVILSTSLSVGFSAGSAIGLLAAGSQAAAVSLLDQFEALLSGGEDVLGTLGQLVHTTSAVTWIAAAVLIAAGIAVQYRMNRSREA